MNVCYFYFTFNDSNRMNTVVLCEVLALFVAIGNVASEVNVGEFETKQHGVGGTVYIVDEHTLSVKGFTYDGLGPDALFWAGRKGAPSADGTILPYPFKGNFYDKDDKSAPIVTGKFSGKVDITLKTPENLTTTDIKWLSVWCRAYKIDFGSFYFDTNGVKLDADAESEPGQPRRDP